MNKWLLVLILLLKVNLSATAQHQPVNFMVSDLTFERPPAWKWIETVTTNEKARLYIFDDETKEKALASFELTSSNSVQSFIDQWKKPYVRPNSAPKVELRTNVVNQYRVITVDIIGAKMMNKRPVPNQATHGVVIDIKNERIGARLLGTELRVAELKPVFTEMINQALKPDE